MKDKTKGIFSRKGRTICIERAIGRATPFITIFLMLSSPFYAQPLLKTYGDVNKEHYQAMLNRFPEKYYYDLKYIKVFEQKSVLCLGQYWINNGIDIFWDSGEVTLIHELAHHCQIRKGDTLYQAINHEGNFDICEEKIWLSLED